jgi:carbon-monoxide dehydrogenase medium subunit
VAAQSLTTIVDMPSRHRAKKTGWHGSCPKGGSSWISGFAAGIDVSSVDELDRPASALAVHRSRKRISLFRLHRPANVADANRLLADYPSAHVVAGGIDVINRLKCGETIEDVVSIGHLSSLRRIDFANGILQVGAVCTHHDLATSAVVRRTIPALALQWGRIANPRIRFKGTVGGNLMARHPDYEGAALLAAAGATLRYTTPHGGRIVSCAEHFAAACDVSGWLLEGVEVHCERDLRIEYDRSHTGVAGVVLGLTLDGNWIVGARTATTWAYAHLHCAELPVARMPVAALLSEARALAADWASALPEPVTNHLASNRYRRRILEVQLRRALEKAGNVNPTCL